MTTHTRRSVPAGELTGAAWHRSSYSDGAGQNCVEIADLAHTSHAAIAVRDSKAPEGPALLVGPGQFAAFVNYIRDTY